MTFYLLEQDLRVDGNAQLAELRAHLRERDLSCVRLRATHTYDGY